MKLKTKILLLVIPIIVMPLGWLGWTAYFRLEVNAQENSLRQMNVLVDQVARSSMEHLATARANIELFSGSSLVQQYALTVDEADRYRIMQPPLMRLFASYQRAYSNYYELRILLPDGYEDTRSTLTRLPNMTELEDNSEFFKQLQDTDETVIASYSHNPDNGKAVLYVGKKLILRDDSSEPADVLPSLRGYLVITGSLDFLQAQLNTLRVGDNGYMFITDDSGDPLLVPDDKTFSAFDQKQYAQLQQAMLEGRAIIINYNGQPTYFFGKSLQSGMQVYTVMPESDLMVASRDLGLLVAFVTLLTILLASALVLYVINRILIRPIQKLGQTAHEVGRGRFDARTGITSDDEIGELAHAFKEMSDNLLESQNQITYLAYHDALTGLPNRRMFQEYLQRVMAHAQRHKISLALLFLDLDNFKQVNDTIGHHAGDQLLLELSSRLTECLRDEDQLSRQKKDSDLGEDPHNIISRFGGDEFLILMPYIKDPSDAAVVAQRLMDVLSSPFNIKDNEFFIGSSIGISIYPDDGEESQVLLKHADIAMYHAKQHGRNNYQYFNESMNAGATERLAMENDLRKAISNDELILHYQPKVDMRSGEIKSVEALMRWQHPKLGMVPPDKFIPIAEESGLIVSIGEWLIEEATQQLKIWQGAGIELAMSVNISTVQLNKQDIAGIIKNCIEKNKCRPDLLEIELTETNIMEAHERATGMLNDIKALGVQISMDDFGVGYSSFSYLRNLPIDILKIDRSFISVLTTDPDDAAIVSAIIAMAHILKLEVVAEGVETLEQLQFLRERQCDIIQGYLVSKPMTEETLREFIANRNWVDKFNSEDISKAQLNLAPGVTRKE